MRSAWKSRSDSHGHRRWLAVGFVWSAVVITAMASEVADPTPTGDDDLFAVADQLDDPQYWVRIEAARLLRKADRRAVAPVVAAIDHGKLETLLQGLRILRHVAASHPPDQDGGAYDALVNLSARGGVAAYQTRLALTEIRGVRAIDARIQLQRRGAYFGPGKVTIMSAAPTFPIELLLLDDQFQCDDQSLRWFRWLDGVQNVVIKGDAINPMIGGGVSNMRSIERLFLTEGSIDRETWVQLSSLPKLKSLEVHYVKINPDDLDAVAALPISGSLMLNGTGLPVETKPLIAAATAGLDFDFKRGGFLGVMCRSDGGCLITEVVQPSGAAAAGLRPGDEILRVNNKPIRRFDDLRTEIARYGIDETVDVVYRRSGEITQTEMTLGKHQSNRITVPDR